MNHNKTLFYNFQNTELFYQTEIGKLLTAVELFTFVYQGNIKLHSIINKE